MRRAAHSIVLASTFVLFETAACDHRPAPPPPPSPSSSAPAPPGPPLPTVAYSDGSRICLAPVVHDTLGAASCIATPSPASAMVWRKHDELALLLDDGRAGILSGMVFSALPLPPEATWKVPKPNPAPFSLQPGTRAKLVVSDAGEVWLGRCAWMTIVDMPACQAWVFARLGGAPKVQRDEPKAAALVYDVPARGPGDVRLAVEGTRVLCERGAEKSTFTAPAEEGASVSVHPIWLSPSTPWYVVTVAYDHMEVVRYRAFLLRACASGQGEELTGWSGEEEGLVWGPGGVFAYRGDAGWVVRVDGRVAESSPRARHRRPSARSALMQTEPRRSFRLTGSPLPRPPWPRLPSRSGTVSPWIGSSRRCPCCAGRSASCRRRRRPTRARFRRPDPS